MSLPHFMEQLHHILLKLSPTYEAWPPELQQHHLQEIVAQFGTRYQNQLLEMAKQYLAEMSTLASDDEEWGW